MSDQINDFDQIFRERLSGQTAAPPPAVWENIQSTRSFGHVVANRISTNWGMFGTLLMLVLAGSSAVYLFGGEENNNVIQAELINSTENIRLQHEVESLGYKVSINQKNKDYLETISNQLATTKIKKQTRNENKIAEQFILPDAQLLASIEQAGFVKPHLENERLAAYISQLEGWESAKPKSFVHYYEMDEISKLSVYKTELDQNPIGIELEEYDYVMPRVKRKSFRERSSILFSFTPQTIRKVMSAEYNLSSSYLRMREKTETTRLAYTFGAQLHYELKNHKFIETGLNFTQIYEEMHYEGEKRFSNQYDFFEVPILFGYGDRNAKWGWEVKAGLGIQIFNNYKGYILKRLDEFGAEEIEPRHRMSKSQAVNNIISSNHRLYNNQARHEVMDLENEDENPFKTNGVINLHLATGLVYYHSIKTSFVITPSYQRSINSITKSDAFFNEKIIYMGVSFGARMKF